MKSLGALTMLSLLVLLCGCGGSQNISGIPVWNGYKKTPPTKLDMEAAQQALALWQLTRDGESHYLCAMRTDIKSKTIYELRHLEVKVLPESLSQADRLNGVEWKGDVRLQPESVRCYCPQRDKYDSKPPDKTWSAWYTDDSFYSPGVSGTEAANTVVLAKKVNGKWEALLMQSHAHKQVVASDLPK